MKYFRYHNTNCFFIENRDGKILTFDAGWPCTLNEYRRLMKSINLHYDDIQWALVSHMHMDHAGLLGEFIQSGINCFACENQADVVDDMERIITKNSDYKDYRKIDKSRLESITTGVINEKLRTIGINGKVIRTEGHSPDSISFITDNHEALIGDLYPIDQIMKDDIVSIKSWDLIIELGVKRIYPGHAGIFDI